MMGKSVFFSEGTAGQMKSAPSFAKDDDSTLPKEPNGSKIGLGPKPIWGMSAEMPCPQFPQDKRRCVGNRCNGSLEELLSFMKSG